ncbi:MAG: DUF2304 domain-containing protein [Ignavibacteriales bacterium]|nr:DUF2304 domain-containing protein [Ignavibacteriales bacterium]
MSLRLKIFVTVLGFMILVGIVELVRRRKLKEEYSFIWLMTGLFFVVLALDADVLSWISELVGIALPVNTLFFMALIFIFLLCLYFSLRISALTTQLKNLAQQFSLLHSEHTDGKKEKDA